MTGNTTITDTILNHPPFPENFLPVAEGLHILNRQVYETITGRDRTELLALAHKHLDSGASALGVNLGTGRKMASLTPWVVETLVQGTTACLFLSANILDHPQLLERFASRIVINAVTAEPETLERAMVLAKNSSCGLVVLLVKPGLTPSGVQDRLALAAEVLSLAGRKGLATNRLYLDPVLSCRPDPYALQMSRGLPDVGTVAETISLLKEIDPGVRTIVGLGTSMQYASPDPDGRMYGSVLTLLLGAGLDAALMNCIDRGSCDSAAGISRAA